MSISAISGLTTNPVQPSNAQTNFRQTFNQLVSALNSGNLSGAQQAFSALGQLQNSGQSPSPSPNSPLANALNQIGQALQNGDITGAQQALASLQQAQGGHHHHGHHGHGANSSATSQSASTSTTQGDSSSSSTNPVDITV
jgi:hypothetical protein